MDNKIALVTGASRGIGKAIATQLGRDGFTVIGTATSAAGAESISAYLSEIGSGGAGMVLDVSDAESVSQVVSAIQDQYGAPAVLVNNAGITKDNLLLRMKEEEWGAVVETNLSSVFRMSKAVMRGMTKSRWGRIVNISSVVASMGNPGQSNYAATKAGIEGYTRSLAKEIAARNITVNSVAPGFIRTDMTDALTEEQKTKMLGVIPAARLGEAEEIAGVVSFLVSDAAAYITGETIHVNGGMYMG